MNGIVGSKWKHRLFATALAFWGRKWLTHKLFKRQRSGARELHILLREQELARFSSCDTVHDIMSHPNLQNPKVHELICVKECSGNSNEGNHSFTIRTGANRSWSPTALRKPHWLGARGAGVCGTPNFGWMKNYVHLVYLVYFPWQFEPWDTRYVVGSGWKLEDLQASSYLWRSLHLQASEKAQSAVADSLAGLGEDGVGPWPAGQLAMAIQGPISFISLVKMAKEVGDIRLIEVCSADLSWVLHLSPLRKMLRQDPWQLYDDELKKIRRHVSGFGYFLGFWGFTPQKGTMGWVNTYDLFFWGMNMMNLHLGVS